jgi:hypothetical protein
LWQRHALPADLLCRRDDLRSARDDDLAILVDDVALEGDTPLDPVPFNRTYGHGDGIAQIDGPLKASSPMAISSKVRFSMQESSAMA